MPWWQVVLIFVAGCNVGAIVGARLSSGPLFVMPDELVPVCGLCGRELAPETPAGELVRYRGVLCHSDCYTQHRGSGYAQEMAGREQEHRREQRRRAIIRSRQRRGRANDDT